MVLSHRKVIVQGRLPSALRSVHQCKAFVPHWNRYILGFMVVCE